MITPAWGLTQAETWLWEVHAEDAGFNPDEPPPTKILRPLRRQLRYRSSAEVSMAVGWDDDRFGVLRSDDRLELAIQHACRAGGLEAWRSICPQRATVVVASTTAGVVSCFTRWGMGWGRLNHPCAAEATRVLTAARAREVTAGLEALAELDPTVDRFASWCQAVDGFNFGAGPGDWTGLTEFVADVRFWHRLGGAAQGVLGATAAILEAVE